MDLEKKAYAIDRLVSADLPMRKTAPYLYSASLEKAGKSLCLAAAEKLHERVKPGEAVFIITGFPIPPKNVCETDGPPGSAVLAFTLRELGLKPVLITDKLCEPVVKAVVDGAIPVELISIDRAKAEEEAEELLARYEPSVLVAIERPGWNSKGEYHTMRGYNISELVGKTDYLFLKARERGLLTVAVGDGGNELGCGLVEDVVKRYVPYGSECQCPCKAGIAAATPADVLVIAATSNWGAYAISAVLSLLSGIRYEHDGKRELLLLQKVLNAGGVDGVTGQPTLTVDGLPTTVNQLLVELIWAIANA